MLISYSLKAKGKGYTILKYMHDVVLKKKKERHLKTIHEVLLSDPYHRI